MPVMSTRDHSMLCLAPILCQLKAMRAGKKWEPVEQRCFPNPIVNTLLGFRYSDNSLAIKICQIISHILKNVNKYDSRF